jgi:predicted ATPase/DNA-binding SARP family transcriptional activator
MMHQAGTPPSWSARLFGPFQVSVHGSPLTRIRSRKGRQLLALLALRTGQDVERDWLACTLWPDHPTSHALALMRRELTNLRRAFGTEPSLLHSLAPRTLRLEGSAANVDALRFDHAIARADALSLEEAIALYHGPLLEGWTEEWVFQEREAREQAYLQALEKLAAAALDKGDLGMAEGYLRRAVAVDPLRESAQRALMQALAASGNDAAALLTYRELRLLLHRELNAEPDPETQALFRQLREEARRRAEAPPPARANTRASPATGGTPAPCSRPGPGPRRCPLRGLDAGPNNLSVQPTPLIGRKREVATLHQMLHRNEVRLLTLTGPGGTGKTRLALQVAADLLEEFVDGVFFVDLAPIRDPGLAAPTVAQTLGVRETGGESLVERLKSYLRDKQLLLVLDNFEQVLEAAPTVAALLGAAPRLKVLVTSRAVLRVRGEQEFAVPPLALPDPRQLPPVEALSQYAALELFIQRAVSARPEFTVTNANVPAVAEICHRLDGLPLAIELAAARMRLFTPQGLLSRLGSRLKLLTGGPRDLPARQQTLRDTIAWSYDLLTEAERMLFRRLSVFVGGCTLEAAEAVSNAAGDLQIPVLDGVASLLDQSLLRQVESEGYTAGWGGEPRFVMLETIREFGLEQLEQNGEAEAIQRQHARYFVQLAEEAHPGGLTPSGKEWLDRVGPEHDNLRAALLWSHQEPTARETEQRLVVALDAFWLDRGYWREKEQWLEGALARGGPEERGLADAGPRSFSSSEAGVQAPLSGEMDREQLATWGRLLLAAGRYEESIAIWRQLGDKYWYACALSLWGNHRSVAPCEEAVSLLREFGNRSELVIALYFLGNAALAEGDYAQARSHYEESLALARELDDLPTLARPIWGLGQLARELGDYEAARAYYEETVALRREQDDAHLPHCLNDLGEVASGQGDLAEAAQAFEEALAIGRDRGLPDVLTPALVGLGRVAWHRVELELARARGEEGLMIAEKEGDRQGIARALLLLGRAAQAQGDSETAQLLLRRSLSLCHELGKRRELAEPLEALAAVNRAEGQFVRAARLLGAAAALRDTTGPPVPPIDQAERVSALRAALGVPAFAAAWAEGRRLTPEQAVHVALEEDEIPTT